MGTRGLTTIEDSNGEEILVMYRQYDCYPSGHGVELASFLDDFQIVNGIPLSREGKIANGMKCLAAQLVQHFKDGAGGIYVHQAGTRDCGEEYVYRVYLEGKPQEDKRSPLPTLKVDVFSGPVTFFGMSSKKGAKTPEFSGTVKEFVDWCENQE